MKTSSKNTSLLFLLAFASMILAFGPVLAADPPLGIWDVSITSVWHFEEEYEFYQPTAFGYAQIDPNPGSSYWEYLPLGTSWQFDNIQSYASGTVYSILWPNVTGVTVVTYPDCDDSSEITGSISQAQTHEWQTVLGE